MRRLVIGDIHGRVEALKQCLERSSFDFDNDKLIVIGDVCDGGYNTYEVIEELLKIKNLVFVRGNHDQWFINSFSGAYDNILWLDQGGNATIKSYDTEYIPLDHQKFFNNSIPYHEEDNKLFLPEHKSLPKEMQ